MISANRYSIEQSATIVEALRMLDYTSNYKVLTLLVVDENQCLVGTLTDGDIRRALLLGATLQSKVSEAMQRDYSFLEQGQDDDNIARIAELRKKAIKFIPIVDKNRRVVKVLNLNSYRSCLPVDAVLMAGGRGERLRPMTLSVPKPLLKVAGKSIIDYNIENLLRNGVENISVTVNYLGEQIEEHFKNPYNGIQIQCVREPQYLGTMGSVKFVKEWHNDTLLVMNSDLFTNIDLEDFFVHFQKHDAMMSVAAVPYTVSVPLGIFEIENTRDIVGVREKPSYHYYANAGIYLIRREALDLIADGEFMNATDLIEMLIERNKKVVRFPLSGYWIDIGKPEDFQKAQEFAKHINKI